MRKMTSKKETAKQCTDSYHVCSQCERVTHRIPVIVVNHKEESEKQTEPDANEHHGANDKAPTRLTKLPKAGRSWIRSRIAHMTALNSRDLTEMMISFLGGSGGRVTCREKMA
jgi:hypothetical protein